MTRIEFRVLGSQRALLLHVLAELDRLPAGSEGWVCVDRGALDAWRAKLAERPEVRLICPESPAPTKPFRAELLLNLSAGVSPLFSAFVRTVELIDGECDRAKGDGRVRFRFYRDRGYPLKTRVVEPATGQTNPEEACA